MSLARQHHGGIVVVGSLNADNTVRVHSLPAPGETVLRHDGQGTWSPGGKGANQAVAAARQGARVAIVGAVGDDSAAHLVTNALTEAGVDPNGLVTLSDTRTGTALILVDDVGQNSIAVFSGANGKLTVDHIARTDAFASGAAVLCASLETPADVVCAATRRAKESGMLTIVNLSPCDEIDPELLRHTDVGVLNEVEAQQFVKEPLSVRSPSVWQDIGRSLRQRNLRQAIITLGGDGAVVFDEDVAEGRGVPHHLPAPPVVARDTTGCGDAFIGALAARLADGQTLRQAARHAVAVAAITATRPGTQSSPTFDEVVSFSMSDRDGSRHDGIGHGAPDAAERLVDRNPLPDVLADRLRTQLEFIVEIDRLKTVVRQSPLAALPRRENDAEHSWHLAVMVMFLAEHADQAIDVGRTMAMVTVHDLVEIYAGDTPLYDADGSRDQSIREHAAAAELCALLPDDQAQRLHELWEEFEQRRSPEARFAKAMDRLQPLLLNWMNRGGTWRTPGVTVADIRNRKSVIKDASESLWEAAQQIIDEGHRREWSRSQPD
ncbi:PfkB family carbohydrate kinase [Streptomyces hainanensis]|uniref:Ribokinase n=1 Tax=Streptomyces hainanensis TaxID=402648 RepID=A0A4R4TDZ0_9ACTN|nr:PfkB family carbohydrate kinase [Streptomyces hainanensis]TDC75577.1 HD domain-containing protein [Streptomyces hainanensis]